MLTWLIEGGLGPALVALPVDWTAQQIASAARRWFQRLRHADDLSRLVRAATGSTVDLSRAEFAAVRRLLEDERTWIAAGQGTVESLARRVASCLPPREGRTADDARAAAMTIARGLLEFAVAGLDANSFQHVLLARLQRMETGQASELDKAMLGLHADLVAGFASVMRQLERMMDRLPPGPAHRLEIAVYLKTLIGWLNRDTWPQDQRFGGPALAPAAIERTLRVSKAGQAGELDLDADGMAQRCSRLVVLGAPGSGKTWLARRIARRCAEDAVAALAAGDTLDEVELPLYTTCSRLFGARGDVREAAVSSALDQLADLGGSRINAAIRRFFTERNAPTVLVIDSLDEARGPDERLRQADTLPWRIVLTTRPTSWNHQLVIDDSEVSHRIGELQPLRYPGDVESFIACWFAHQPGQGHDLAAQIAHRPGLQQAATVPLVLAFFCIVGGDAPLPDFRRDLYARVLRRVLTGRWRGTGDRQPDVDACLQTLRAWTWAGAAGHPVSGVGTWADDIPAERARLSEADREALDHVASPLGPPDVDTGKALRRFIHRSIREHLVAEHVASLPVDEAAGVLLPHLWYDPDWEYAAPAAIAAHSQHDQLLRELICRAARSDQMPEDLSVIDAGWQFRILLARIASESAESDWSPQLAQVIGRARIELARPDHINDLSPAPHWHTSNRQARDALLRALAFETDFWTAAPLAGGLIRLDPSARDKRRAREALLGLLAGATDGSMRALRVDTVVISLADALIQLDPTADDKCQAREALLGLLARPALSGHLAFESDGWMAAELAGALIRLDPTAQDKRKACEALLGLLAHETWGFVAAHLAGGLSQLDPTAWDKRQAREALLELLARESTHNTTEQLVHKLVKLSPTTQEKRQAREALLGLLAREPDRNVLTSYSIREYNSPPPTGEDKRQAREAVIGLLADQADGQTTGQPASGEARPGAAAEHDRQIRDGLLGLLASQTTSTAAELARWIVQLGPTAQDKRQARDALLGLLAQATSAAAVRAGGQAWPEVEEEDRRAARDDLLWSLRLKIQLGHVDRALVRGVVQLATTTQDKRQAREALLRRLDRKTDAWEAAELAGGLIRLAMTTEDKRQARDVLLRPLADGLDGRVAAQLVGEVVQLATTAEDKRQVRNALLRLLAGQTHDWMATALATGVAQLDPTIRDLSASHTWAAQPTAGLLAAARQNTALADWIAAIPSLATLSS